MAQKNKLRYSPANYKVQMRVMFRFQKKYAIDDQAFHELNEANNILDWLYDNYASLQDLDDETAMQQMITWLEGKTGTKFERKWL
jgi:hypothetical protein